MPPWGQQSLSTIAFLDGVAPLQATLRRGARGYVVQVKNTTGTTLRNATILEEDVPLDWSTPYVELGDLAPGETREVTIRRGARGNVMIFDEENTWFAALDLPQGWDSWAQVIPRYVGSGSALRYRVVSRVDARLTVHGSNLDTVNHTLRVDPIAVEGGMERGYMGIKIEAGSTTSWGNGNQTTEVRVASVNPSGPAKRAGMTRGLVINTLNNRQVTSLPQFMSMASRYLPGEKIHLRCWDSNTNRQKTITIKLVSRASLGE